MPTFNNLDSLMEYVAKDLEKAMEDVGQMARSKVESHIWSDVYSFKPEEYDRTDEFAKSTEYDVTMKNKLTAMALIDISPDKVMQSVAPYYHYSVKPLGDQTDFRPYLAEAIEDGTSGLAFGIGFWTSPRPFMENAFKEIEAGDLHVLTLKKAMKRLGYTVL